MGRTGQKITKSFHATPFLYMYIDYEIPVSMSKVNLFCQKYADNEHKAAVDTYVC